MNPSNAPSRDHRLAAYATLAGVALAAPIAHNADATIVWSGPVNITIPSDNTGVYLNVVTGVFSSTPAAAPGWDVNPWGSSDLRFFTPTPNPGGGEMVGTGSTYFTLPFGFVVGSFSTFASAGTTTLNAGTPFTFNSTDNYVGFRFINEAAGGQIQYGWLQLGFSGSASSQPRVIVSYAYEDSGGPIFGFVPEPATLSLLTLVGAGAVGVRTWRKHRKRC